MTLRITNPQHHTTVTITLAEGVEHITPRTFAQLRKLLCGVERCNCRKAWQAYTLDTGERVQIEKLHDDGLLFRLPPCACPDEQGKDTWVNVLDC